ncbi:hypothetical protein MMC12_004868 [Toensbergia leucococca]|nr:hypothetical protein [Toensbergia leucococca]
MPPPQAVLITGTSAGGIGSALALAFQARGLRVFATARTPSKASHLASLPNVSILPLDVTSPASIAAAVEAVSVATEGRGLDILVNNSGTGYSMPLLDADLEEGRRCFEVNVWGTLALLQAFGAQIVGRKGVVVNISSVGGELYTPWIGLYDFSFSQACLYAASKAATTCLSETLRLELAPFGVKVITAMVGTVRSTFLSNNSSCTLPSDSLYAPIQTKIADAAAGKIYPGGMDVDTFAKRLVSDVLGGSTGRVWRGNVATVVRFISSFLPTFIVDHLILGGQGMDELNSSIRTKGVGKKA